MNNVSVIGNWPNPSNQWCFFFWCDITFWDFAVDYCLSNKDAVSRFHMHRKSVLLVTVRRFTKEGIYSISTIDSKWTEDKARGIHKFGNHANICQSHVIIPTLSKNGCNIRNVHMPASARPALPTTDFLPSPHNDKNYRSCIKMSMATFPYGACKLSF